MIRLFEFVLSIVALLFFSPILLIVIVLGYLDTKSPIFVQERVGRNMKPFRLLKFRTMRPETESVASHLASKNSITRLGSILRKTKVDELPQLINVIKGEMSLVGPRPNLFNQTELIKERKKHGIYEVLPGITGLAQINNIDMSKPKQLAETDRQMIDTLTFRKYISYIIRTVLGSGAGDAVR
ncbi:sugar transferase [Enterovibrio norvegicus]|uniref:sugar transferase n=1 Tax=Enterovibrio norvegicus TaxID=188144 RepID=UPI00389A8781